MGNIFDLNNSVENLFSIKVNKDQLIGKNLSELFELNKINKDLINFIKIGFKRIIDGDILEPLDLLLNRKDGSNIWVNLIGSLVRIGRKKYIQIIVHDITESKNITEALKQSEARFKGLIEIMNDGFGIIDKKGKITYVNKKICNILDYSANELKQTHFLDIIDDNYKELALKEFTNRKKGIINKYELEMIKKNGEKVNIILSPVPIFDKNKNFNGAFAIVSDVTDQIKKERNYKENYEKLEYLSQIIIAGNQADNLKELQDKLLNNCLKILNFNAGVIYLLNPERNDAGLMAQVGIPPELTKEVANIDIKDEYYKKVFFEGQPIFLDDIKDGSLLSYKNMGFSSLMIVPITKKDKIIGALKLISKNPYKFSKFESDLFQAIGREIGTALDRMLFEEKLRESEEKYRNLFENSPNVILIVDTSGIIIDCNTLSETFSGFKKSELIGKRFLDINGIPKQYIPQIVNDFKKVLKGKIAENDIQLYTKGGTSVWNHYRASIFKQGEENIIQVIIQVIDDKKKAEDQLKSSEEKYRFITENIVDVVSVYDENFKLIYINENQEKVTGYTPSETYGKIPLEFIHPDDKKKAIQLLKDIYKKKEASGVYRMINKKGDYLWMDVRAKLSRDVENKERYILVSRDITERILAQNQIQESEEKFRTLAEQSIAGIIIMQDKKFKYVNQRLSDITGYTVEEMLKWEVKDFIKTIHPDDLSLILEKLKERENGLSKEINHYQFKGFKKSGEVIWDELYSKMIIYEGKLADFITVMDITEQKESEFKYRVISENANDLICIINKDLLIEYINEKAFKKILGYSQEDLIGNLNVSIIHPEDIKKALINFKDSLNKGSATIQIRLVNKNGNYLWFEIKGTPFYDKNGKAKAILIARDISWHKEIEEQLKEINRLKTDLLRRTSHELKTPLIAIKGNADLLLKLHKDKLDAKLISIVKEMKNGCIRLENIIIDLLKSSQLESGKLKLKKTYENLSFLIKFTIHELMDIAEKRNQTIKVDVEEDLMTYFEKEKIHEVLSNLLTNAIKNTPPKGIIHVKTHVNTNEIKISIQDNGVGITPEEKKTLFTQFGKIERYGKGLDLGIEGTGLGLYISKKLVQLHGGKIGVESEGRNKGAIFYFTLPLIKKRKNF